MNDSFFKNQEELLSKPESDLRIKALQMAEAGIRKVIPYEATKEQIVVEGKNVRIGSLCIDLNDVNNIYVVGAGKGSFPIAQALDEIFDGQIKKGVVVVKDGERRRLNNIEVFESSHPIPDERSIVAAEKIMGILNLAKEGDLVIAAITGGSSALVNMPAADITIEDLEVLNQQLLRSGAEIGKINSVRKHICMMKGGKVVQYGQPAMVVTLTFDTAPPDMPWPDMCLPDPSTFKDAIKVLQTYQLWDSVPKSVRKYLEYGLCHPELETLKSLSGMKQELFSIADPRIACLAAAEKAKQLGYEPYILSTTMEGEAKDVGIVLAGITNEILSYERPFKAQCALISGGETTVTINGEAGEGGPNQETVLGFINKIRHDSGYACISIDTDGTDGPCDAAGGIVDGATLKEINRKEISVSSVLHKHSSLEVLKELGDAIYTGHTGTNVMNLRIVVVDKEKK